MTFQFLYQEIPHNFKIYLNVQHDPQPPWSLTGLTIPSSLQSFCSYTILRLRDKLKKKACLQLKYVFFKLKKKQELNGIIGLSDARIRILDLRFPEELLLWVCGFPLKWQSSFEQHQAWSFETLATSYQQTLYWWSIQETVSKVQFFFSDFNQDI